MTAKYQPPIINVYSKSEYELGRLLSNFAYTPFVFKELKYCSVEAFWYFYITGEQHHHLRELYGFTAKKEGRKHPRVTEISRSLLRQVYLAKLKYNVKIKEMLLKYNGEFTHSYYFNGVEIPAKKWLWTAKLWEGIRDDLQAEENDKRELNSPYPDQSN